MKLINNQSVNISVVIITGSLWKWIYKQALRSICDIYEGANMKLEYRNAKKEDAKLLTDIYNKSFYDDYIHYGECPKYIFL